MERVAKLANQMTDAGQKRPPITSHVLDQVSGKPAVGVRVVLEFLDTSIGDWRMVRRIEGAYRASTAMPAHETPLM